MATNFSPPPPIDPTQKSVMGYPYPSQNPYPHYYTQPQPPYAAVVQPPQHSFGRLMLILMISLIAAMFLMSIVVWLLFGTSVPEFEVTSIKLSNFTATDTTLTGIWDADIVINNTDEDVSIQFDDVRSWVFYRGHVLGISFLGSFKIHKNETFQLKFRVLAEKKMVDNLQGWVLKSLAEEYWSNGIVDFSLRLTADAKYSCSDSVYRTESLMVFCDDMRIRFSVAADEGILISEGLENECLIRVHDSLV